MNIERRLVRLAPGGAAVLIMGSLLGVPAAAAPDALVQYVDCDRGSDANTGLTPDAPKRTLQSALNSTPDGTARTLRVSGTCIQSSAVAAPTNAIRSVKCSTDVRRGTAAVTIKFYRPPDFFTLDEFGRQAFSFQVFADAAAAPAGISDFHAAAAGQGDATSKTIVRGEEIHINDDLRVRAIVPFYEEEGGGGGWGPILDEVPYQLDGATLTFSAPLASFRDGGDGRMWFFLEAYENGATAGSTVSGLCRPTTQGPRSGR
jgi:hypothetical protein